jgi:hypothetical protein
LLPDSKIVSFSFSAPLSPPYTNTVTVSSKNGSSIGQIVTQTEANRIRAVLAQPDGKVIVVSDKIRRYLSISDLSGRQSDFDKDKKTDIGYFRPSDGTWSIQKSAGGEFTTRFGTVGDYVVQGRYLPTTMIAVYRPAINTWYFNSICANQLCREVFGDAGDVPVGGDYDGDGRDDLSTFNNGIWHVLKSLDGSKLTIKWGTTGDVPVTGDYDYDGFTDFAVYRPQTGTWYVLLSSDGNAMTRQFGGGDDVPVLGDFDGDGRTDFAVYRPAGGQWYILNSRDGSVSSYQFGLATDKPVPGDYDGDGRTDIGVFRDGSWYLLKTKEGFSVVTWGMSGDVPLTPGYAAQ